MLLDLAAQGGGRLLQLSSMGGHIAFPAFSMYHAAKWGIEGFYEALAQEIEPFGIRTILVEPGMSRTGFYDAATRVPASEAYGAARPTGSGRHLDQETPLAGGVGVALGHGGGCRGGCF